MRRRAGAACLVAALLLVALAAGTIRSLRPWVDEAWYGTPAWTLVERGYMGTPSLDVGPTGMQRIDHYSYWIMPLYPLVQAAWYIVAPFSLMSMRVLSVVFVLIGVACFSLFVLHLTRDAATATLSFALLCCDYIVVTAAGIGRPDALAFACCAASFAIYVVLRENHLAWALFAGNAFAVASGLTHPNGGLLTVAGLSVLALFFDRHRLRPALLGVAALPYLVGAVGWGAYIFQDPTAFRSQYGFQTAGRFDGLIHPFAAISAEIHTRYLNNMGLGQHSEGSTGPHFLKAFVFLGYFTAIVGILATRALRMTAAARVLLTIAAADLVFYTFLEGTKAAYYLIYLVPVYSALLALWVRDVWRRRSWPRWVVALGIAGIMAIQTGGTLHRMRTNKYQGWARAVAHLKARTSPHDLVVGSHELGFGVGFTDRFVDDPYLGTRSGRVADYVVIEEIYRMRLQTLREQSPADYARVRTRLGGYEVVYSKDFYDILARNR